MKGLVLTTVFFVSLLCHTGVVEAEGAAGEDCTAEGECTNTNKVTCVGHTEDDAGTCRTKAGQNCVAKSDCIEHATCSAAGQPCACDPATHVAKGDNTACLKQVDQICSDNTECADNAACTAGEGGSKKCTCKEGYTKNDKGGCAAKDGALGLTASFLLLVVSLLTSRLL